MTDIAPYLPGFIAAYSILLVGSSSSGPSVAMLVGIATEQGHTPALAATLGIAVGSMTINILTILGVGFILLHAVWTMSLLRIIGVAYFLYLAYGAISKAIHSSELQVKSSVHCVLSRQFTRGYLLQVTNPKAISFWLAIASVGAVEGAGIEVIILFVAGAFLISFICHGVWAVALSIAPIRAAYISGRRWVEAALGCFFIFAAYKLAVSER